MICKIKQNNSHAKKLSRKEIIAFVNNFYLPEVIKVKKRVTSV